MNDIPREANGAGLLVDSLLSNGVEVCFTNPGTSEMHFVAALDARAGLRCVLGLHETVVTGAADGYFRISGKPAATLLHLGPGLCNGLANLHNARKAGSGVVNVVGDHTAEHLLLDAPLTSDLPAIAASMSDSVRYLRRDSIAGDTAHAVWIAKASKPAIATLVLPADVAWSPAMPQTAVSLQEASANNMTMGQRVDALARALADKPCPTLILVGGTALRAASTRLAGQLASRVQGTIRAECFVARMERGAGRVSALRLPYAPEAAEAVLKPFQRIILVNAREPVAFFAYPHRGGRLASPGCEILTLSSPGEDAHAALEQLVDALGARNERVFTNAAYVPTGLPSGPLQSESIARVIAATLPADAIVVDEAVSTGWKFDAHTEDAAPHDWLNGCGGAIGFGLPAALGAALAAPGRRVLSLEGDGSGMYSLQALWSMAREGVDVTVLIFVNRSYGILRRELSAVGVEKPGVRAIDMLSLDRPGMDWCAMAKGMGVPSVEVSTTEALEKALRHSFASTGPSLIAALI